MPVLEIYTVGHSIRSESEFLDLLKTYNIQVLADIRNFPGSKRYPHFNGDHLEKVLQAHGIRYMHFKDLGGHRQPRPDSINTAWRSMAFRGYADYMRTEAFEKSLDELLEVAGRERTAYMCSEALWWKCHRALVSDFLKVRGWKVLHIMDLNKLEEHSFTRAAKVRNGELSYQR